MASRYRSVSRPAFSLIKSTFTKPTSNSKPSPFLLNNTPSSPTLPRSIAQLGCVQSLLPLHSAVSSARLTSCLGIDSSSSRSLTQGMLCSANPGV
ncbi:hypothetical protein TanjilG_28504 [Lupinus angustifolius]|uniref:Uncharacterized protein n=1 Tax=Lupinus angustifolius TaxID=3871 RepID=A0A394DCQ7_LUPAN|nr:PREDICTED: uncharacterized protein LOC109339283 [Lupinus angustifolius]OIW21058.1 hypothetical protein TanjilG_28504 [Lupinus angustifolius]